MIVIKVGGSIVDGLHSSTILDLKNILKKDKVVLVHGGGKDVTVIGNKLGKEQKFIVSPGGVKSRYTDKETAEIYTMVMSGKINKTIVRLLLSNGISAAGISGIDGSTIEALRKKKLLVVNGKGRKMIIDGGYTGKINKINTLLIRNLIEGNFVPVVSPIALREEKEFLNSDGDRAAAYIAGGLSADKVIFITNVDGLILNDELVKKITYDKAKESLPKIGHGMEKKVMACIESLDMGVKEAIIASGDVENPVSSALFHTNCMGGYGVALIGHCNDRVVNAIKNQSEKLITCHMSIYNNVRLEFLEKMSKISPKKLSKIFFSNSGAESTEAALKFSRKFTGKSGIIAMSGGYHGKTFGALSVTHNEKYRKSFQPLLEGVKFVPYSNPSKIEESLDDSIGTVIIEPIQGETRII